MIYLLNILHCSWMLQKQPKPLSSELVRFPPYIGGEDCSRGTTVLPYLEVYYNYNEEDYVNFTQGVAIQANTESQAATNHTQIPNIAVTQSDSDSRISQYKSRIPSQENGKQSCTQNLILKSSKVAKNKSITQNMCSRMQ